MGFWTIIFAAILILYVVRLFRQGVSGRGTREKQQEGDITVYKTHDTPSKRINEDVGEYVDYKEVKDKKE